MTQPPEPIKLTEPPPDQAECDAALGAYVRAWDLVHLNLLPLLSKLLGTHISATLILLSAGINQPTLKAVFEAIAGLRLAESDQKKLVALLRRWSRASYKRNRIVHGFWMLDIEVIPEQGGGYRTKAEWVRFYQPTDPALMNVIFGAKDPEVRAKHVFTLSQITRASSDLNRLATDLETFHSRIQLRPFEDPQPITLPQ